MQLQHVKSEGGVTSNLTLFRLQRKEDTATLKLLSGGDEEAS